MNRDDRSGRSFLPAAVLLLATFGCGSVTAQNDAGKIGADGSDGGAAGAAGQTGAAGDQGAGGRGEAGSGGAAGSGQAGVGGGAADAGGVGDAGTKDASDASGNACSQVTTVDRSCMVDADCLAVTHTTNCCGSAVWLGIRTSEKQRFATLESACDRTYPACGCAAGPPVTDDGSIVQFGGTAGVSCQAGTCKTFSKACGHPCAATRNCSTCMAPDAGTTSSCSLRCMKDTDCTEPGRTKCQFVFAGGTCIDATLACGAF